VPLLNHNAGGYENGLSRERDPYTLQHNPNEDKQVSVLSDQGESLIYGGHVVVILLLAYNYTARGRLLGTDMTPLDARACLRACKVRVLLRKTLGAGFRERGY
jgi:hypothetical protein